MDVNDVETVLILDAKIFSSPSYVDDSGTISPFDRRLTVIRLIKD